MADKSDSIGKKGGINSALSASNKRVLSTDFNKHQATTSTVQDNDLDNQSLSPIRTR